MHLKLINFRMQSGNDIFMTFLTQEDSLDTFL